MNKEQQIKELEQTIAQAQKKIYELTIGEFSFEFNEERFGALNNGQIYDSLHDTIDSTYYIPNAYRFESKKSSIISARRTAWHNLLQHLANFVNPDGWEWELNENYCVIRFKHGSQYLDNQMWTHYDCGAVKFHPDSVYKAIKILNANKPNWWHLISDEECPDE